MGDQHEHLDLSRAETSRCLACLGSRELVSGFVVLTSVMLLLFAREPGHEPEPARAATVGA